jgi:hypothetical protein
VLSDPDVDVAVVQQIKDHAKELAKGAQSDLQREVATMIYYAAIASALVYHDTVITKRAYGKLHQSFDKLRHKTWLGRGIGDLLRRASEICEARTRNGE